MLPATNLRACCRAAARQRASCAWWCGYGSVQAGRAACATRRGAIPAYVPHRAHDNARGFTLLYGNVSIIHPLAPYSSQSALGSSKDGMGAECHNRAHARRRGQPATTMSPIDSPQTFLRPVRTPESTTLIFRTQIITYYRNNRVAQHRFAIQTVVFSRQPPSARFRCLCCQNRCDSHALSRCRSTAC